jgi:hypothetical protein
MKLPNYSLLVSQVVNILTLIGGVVTTIATVAPDLMPLLPAIIPNPQTRSGVIAGFILINALNHRVAALSFPDGTPVNVKTEKTVATVETHQNIPQEPASEPSETTVVVTGKETKS